MEFDDRLVLVLDKFPKARRHLLVIARDPQLQGPLNLTAAEVPLLEHMEHKAQQWVARQEAQDPALTFKMGFHAAPSMQQLHLHVISQVGRGPAVGRRSRTRQHSSLRWAPTISLVALEARRTSNLQS